MAAFDAQTSGGLLICARDDLAVKLVADLKNAGLEKTSVIGKVTGLRSKMLYLEN